ncbi:MAG: N-acetylmuramoyl-L-alanine amidase [Verrucomicrobiales bacterium]|nr:N-acetylmuramoyl-L-alanine amidase [Verrucomicrobiales bacterium]
MNTRRAFIRRIATVGLVLAMRSEAFAKRQSHGPIRFTKLVRSKTASIPVQRGRWEWIVGHHSAIKYGNAMVYDRAHRQRGMENGLAYHFVIGNGVDSGDGEIEIGARWLKQLKGGHVRSEDINEVGIGICLVGNFEEGRPTSNQLIAFQELVDYLRSDVVGKRVRFAVHREIEPGRTVCPGRNFPIARMRQRYGRLILPRSA